LYRGILNGTPALFFQRGPALPHQIGVQDAFHPAVDVVGEAAHIKTFDEARRLHQQCDCNVDCVEGMRKFTTEVFDTGVALAGYAVMLLVYDWRLAILGLLFTPVSYVCAAGMKKPVQRAGAAYKKAAGALSSATLDRARNAVTYRIYAARRPGWKNTRRP